MFSCKQLNADAALREAPQNITRTNVVVLVKSSEVVLTL